MSQLILDEQLKMAKLLPAIKKWITVQHIQDLRPTELIPDERIPAILLTLRQPTFVTIDSDFWDRTVCHPDYCILYFALSDDKQQSLPDLLRELLRHPEFSTRARPPWARWCESSRTTSTTGSFQFALSGELPGREARNRPTAPGVLR